MSGDEVVPVHSSLRRDGNPFLWVLDAPFPASGDEGPLASPPFPEQLQEASGGAQLPKSSEPRDQLATWREILDERVFRIERPPRS